MVSETRFIHQALLQEALEGRVRCLTCERRCVISPRSRGWCLTRQNRGGRLVTLGYGAISSLAANPIEKKPFYHFHPGSQALTAGGWSCNFGCPWCQNWRISKTPPPARGDYLSPEQFVRLACDQGCQGTSISFNEPTLLLEWSLDVFCLAREFALYNTYVTNGYMTPEALEQLIAAGLDAMNIDIKGDATAVRKYCKGVNVEKVWRTCRLALSRGIHLEITTLVIPTVNASDDVLGEIAARIANELGPEVPWHVSGYFPAHRFTDPPTSIQTLEHAWEIGKAAGLSYVYIGNAPGNPHDNTYCPQCNTLLIQRLGFDVVANVIRNGRCPHCQRIIAGVWD